MYTKEEILSKMKRTAIANGGKPLGHKRFADETGIRPCDWQKYWSTYGNLVSEAGLTPNKPYTKYPKGVLEEKIIHVIRKLRKYPTINELRLEKLSEQGFPFRAIKRRWNEVKRDVIQYCENNPGHDDILEICQPIIEQLRDKENGHHASQSNTGVGQVYLYRRGKYYKIGFSKDLVRRGKEIQIETPDPLKLIHRIVTDDPSGVEAYWHKRFENKRYKDSEFFSLNSQDITAFKRWKKIY
jgi:hypothetical protein